MDEGDIDRLASRLADARRQGIQLRREECDLRKLGSEEEAAALQAAASLAFGGSRIGYALVATTAQTARLLNCPEPIVGPLFMEERLPSGSTLRVTRSMLGIGAQYVFVFGSSYPKAGSPAALDTIADAIASCRLGMQVLARRTGVDTPFNDWIGTADFGLSECYVEGPSILEWRGHDLGTCDVEVAVDGRPCTSGQGCNTLGHPLAPLVWLARRRAAEGLTIEAGDIVAAGSCTTLLQLTPGHEVTSTFGDLGSVTIELL